MVTVAGGPEGKRRPQPPRKSTAAEGQMHRRRRGSCLGLSCFGASSVADSDDRHLVERESRAAPSWFTWSRFRKKKKTVPLETSTAIDCGEDPPSEGEGARKQHQHRRGADPASTTAPPPAMSSAAAAVAPRSFFWRLWKTVLAKDVARSKVRQGTVSAAVSHERRQAEAPPHIPPVTTRCRASRPGPAAAPSCTPSASSAVASSPSRPTNLREACRKETRAQKKSELEAPPPHPAAENGQVLGLSVMAVVLAVLLLFGRVGAVLLTCLWFYCLPRLRPTVMDRAGGGGGDKSRIDVDSEEYKKKVVLEGLLQRNGRRMPNTLA